MKIFLASDHTGFEIKEKVKEFLQVKNYEVVDCGAYAYNPEDDYPDFMAKAAAGVAADPENSFGIIFGGSGQGEAMVANKFKGVRCALFYSKEAPTEAVDIKGTASTDPFEILKLTKQHNHANMLSIGVRFLKEEDIFRAIEIWLATGVSNEPRHLQRIEKIKQIESNNQ